MSERILKSGLIYTAENRLRFRQCIVHPDQKEAECFGFNAWQCIIAVPTIFVTGAEVWNALILKHGDYIEGQTYYDWCAYPLRRGGVHLHYGCVNLPLEDWRKDLESLLEEHRNGTCDFLDPCLQCADEFATQRRELIETLDHVEEIFKNSGHLPR